MERTKSNSNTIQALETKLRAYSELYNRLALAQNAGYSYDGDRNLYQALGYKTDLTFTDYYSQYKRQDIAKAVIDRPVQVTWRGKLKIVEAEDDLETKFEKDWQKLDDELKLKSKFSRLDRLTGIGVYGILLLGLDDVKKREDYRLPVTGNRKLLYVMPFTSQSAKIHTWEDKPDSPRYGKPLTYQVTITTPNGSNSILTVHHTRVIHVVDSPLENEIEGTPRLQVIFNRLKDAEKVVGGAAEMFWKGARPGYNSKMDPDFELTEQGEEELRQQINEYEHNLRRILITKGMSIDSMAMQVADPKGHIDVIIQMISMVTNIPKRILTGSERGELASSQDTDEWLSFIKGRREEFAEPSIIKPFIDRCIELGVLTKPSTGTYTIEWEDLFAQSEKEKVDVGKVRSEALKNYSSVSSFMPEEGFMKYFLGFNDDQVSQVQELIEAMPEEEPISQEERQIIEEEQNQNNE